MERKSLVPRNKNLNVGEIIGRRRENRSTGRWEFRDKTGKNGQSDP